MFSKKEIQRHYNNAVQEQQRMRAKEETRKKRSCSSTADYLAALAIRHLPEIIEREAKSGRDFCYICVGTDMYGHGSFAASRAAEKKVREWAVKNGFEARVSCVLSDDRYFFPDGRIAEKVGERGDRAFWESKPYPVSCIKIDW